MITKIIQSQRNSILVILLITAICYSPIVKNEFVTFDDGVLIRYSRIVTADNVTLKNIFTFNDQNPHYKPLVYLTWRAEYSLFGDNPLPFHLNNLLLHLLNTLLVYFLGLRLFSKLKIPDDKIHVFTFIIALLFALHPMHVESVAWATERKDVLYSFFFLLSWLIYLKFLDQKKAYFLVISVLCYALSLISKSMGITLFAVILLTDWIYFGKLSKKVFLQKIPFLLVLIGAMYMYGMFGRDFSEHSAGLTSSTILSVAEDSEFFGNYPVVFKRVIIISFRIVLWILHVLMPVVLSVMYPREQFIEAVGKGILLFPVILAGLVYLIWKWRNNNILYFFGLAFFLITISPAVTINEKGSGVFIPDRYVYVPAIGIYFAALGILRKIKFNAKMLTVLLAVYFIFISTKCYSQVKVWRDSESLWNNTIKYFPDFARALNSRGYYYMNKGENEKALRDLSKAIKNDRNYVGAYNNRCNLLFSMGRFEDALKDINILLLAKPDYVKYITTKAGILSKLKRTDEAVEFSKKALEIDPESFESHKNLAIIYLQSRRYKESIVHWEKVVEYESGNPLNFADMGYALLMVNRNQDALNSFNEAIRQKPDLATAWYNRSFANNRLGFKEKALEDALQAKKLGANVSEGYLNRLR